MNPLDLLPKLKDLNRTLVSQDASAVLSSIEEYLPLVVHRYPTGAEFQTWPVPPEWNVVSGELRDGDRVIASYAECPLFVAIYSAPFTGEVTYEELCKHTFTKPEHPDAFNYEHRIAANYKRRLKEWRIALPHNRLMSLDPSRKYTVDIKVDVKPGNMLVGEHIHRGRNSESFYFLSHYCHPAQINDGLAGVVAGIEFMMRLKERHPNPKYTYRLLILPETFGTAVYCANHFQDLDVAIGAIFSEMPGATADLQYCHTRRGDVYLDRIFRYVLQNRGKPVRYKKFRGGWGNDELMFDAAGIGVPAASLDRFPFPEYHTHYDDMSKFEASQLEEVVDIVSDAVDLIERDFIPKPINRLPVYLTRYDLYSDWTWDREGYDFNQKIIDNLFLGRSIVDVAIEHGLNVCDALSYANKFAEHGLLDRIDVSSEYAREIRYFPQSLNN